MTRMLGTISRRRSARLSRAEDPLWYKDAVIYEIRTRSFFDSNDDGVGDIRGLSSKLDYLADLGITAIWILPHYPSPGRDDGYDIADYMDVHADVGSLQDFDELIEQAHRRDIRIITELVLNHTSDQHAWFQRARRAPPGSPERDFYVWSDTADRYAEARIIFRDFEPSNWTWDPVAKAYFWHRFFSHQPDLNYENPAVHEAMMGVVDFWLARGVDGLRLDAVPYLYESEGTNCENLPATHRFLKKLRAHVDSKFQGRMLLAEANQWPEDAASYFGDGDECHMNFHFPIMPRLFMSIHMEDRFPIIDILRQTPDLHPSCQWAMFLRNHDELTLEMVTDDERDYMYRAYAHEAQMRINLGIRRRLAPLVGNDRKKMELLNGLLFSMPGTPVLYYGDEIGMGDNVYLGDRNGVRTPMQWSADRNAGFSRTNPQRLILPIIIDPEYHYEALNVEAQQSNPNSLLWWTKRLVALRKSFRAFSRGTVEFLHPANPRVLAFVRRFDDEVILVVANLSRHVQYVELDLSSCKHQVPVELFGRTRFPQIGDAPYLLTLGGHDFYWFSLEPSRTASQEERMSLHGPPTIACASLDALLVGEARAQLEEILPAYLEARGLTTQTAGTATITEVLRGADGTTPLVLVFVRVDHEGEEPQSIMLALLPQAMPKAITASGSTPIPVAPPGNVVAHVELGDGDHVEPTVLVEATSEALAKLVLETVASGKTLKGSRGTVVGTTILGALLEGHVEREARVLAEGPLGATIAIGTASLVKVAHRMEEGVAPDIEFARIFRDREALGVVPQVLGYVEYRAPRSEPVTLAVVEEFVTHQGTAWEHARSEIGRAYERVLAHPSSDPLPDVPREPLLELASMDPPAEHGQLIGAYRDWAMLIGRRLAELHRALASATDPAFEPRAYSTMDQRSKYQTARNLIGRVLGNLRRSLGELPASVRPVAERLVACEEDILARFEPILSQRIDARQIRIHGDLHLGRLLFTGRDFVVTGFGGPRDRRLSERRRKGAALRDVAGIVRSFHYAAATSLVALRAEDQDKGEPWGWIWQRWAAAAFVRGYLETAGSASFLPSHRGTTSALLDATMLEKAFVELRNELRNRPSMAWIPMQGILRMVGHPLV